jgi:hypothetical protein
VISGRIFFIGPRSSSISASSTSSSQVSTSREGGSSTNFTMAGQDPTIRLQEFRGDNSYDPENNLFIYEKLWVEKHITDEDTKVAQLEITFRDCALD